MLIIFRIAIFSAVIAAAALVAFQQYQANQEDRKYHEGTAAPFEESRDTETEDERDDDADDALDEDEDHDTIAMKHAYKSMPESGLRHRNQTHAAATEGGVVEMAEIKDQDSFLIPGQVPFRAQDSPIQPPDDASSVDADDEQDSDTANQQISAHLDTADVESIRSFQSDLLSDDDSYNIVERESHSDTDVAPRSLSVHSFQTDEISMTSYSDLGNESSPASPSSEPDSEVSSVHDQEFPHEEAHSDEAPKEDPFN